MNIQRKNSAHHFHMQSEREQTLVAAHLLLLLQVLSADCGIFGIFVNSCSNHSVCALSYSFSLEAVIASIIEVFVVWIPIKDF